MKRPDKSDIEAHRAWMATTVARLIEALPRHPLLVLRAARWLIINPASKGVHVRGEHVVNPPFRGDEVLYAPVIMMKPLLIRFHIAMRGVAGCTCPRFSRCACGRFDHPAIPPADLRRIADWIRENPEQS